VSEPFARPRFWQDTRDFTIVAAVDDAATAALNRFGHRTEEVRRKVEEAMLENAKTRLVARMMDDPSLRAVVERINASEPAPSADPSADGAVKREKARKGNKKESGAADDEAAVAAVAAAGPPTVAQQRMDLYQAVGAAAAAELLQARAELAYAATTAAEASGRETALPLDVQLLERLADVEAAESMKRSQENLLMRQMGRLFTRVAGLAQSSAGTSS
jgi:hypothetical protein